MPKPRMLLNQTATVSHMTKTMKVTKVVSIKGGWYAMWRVYNACNAN